MSGFANNNTPEANDSIPQPTVLLSPQAINITGKRGREQSPVPLAKKPRSTLVPDFKNILGKGTSKQVYPTIISTATTNQWPQFSINTQTPTVVAFQQSDSSKKRIRMIDEIMLHKELATCGLAPDIYAVFVRILTPDSRIFQEEYIEKDIKGLQDGLEKYPENSKMEFAIHEEKCDGGDLRGYLKTILEGQTNIEIIIGMLKSVDQQVIDLTVKIVDAGYINTDFKTENTCVILPRIIGLDFSRVFVISIDEIMGKAVDAGIVLDKQQFIEKSLLYMRIQYYITFISSFYRFNRMDYRKILGTVLTEQGVTLDSVNDMVDYMAMFNEKNIFQHYPGGLDASPMQMLHHYWNIFLENYIKMTNKKLLGLKSFKSILGFALGLRDDIIFGNLQKAAGSKSRRARSLKARSLKARSLKARSLKASKKMKSRKSI